MITELKTTLVQKKALRYFRAEIGIREQAVKTKERNPIKITIYKEIGRDSTKLSRSNGCNDLFFDRKKVPTTTKDKDHLCR